MADQTCTCAFPKNNRNDFVCLNCGGFIASAAGDAAGEANPVAAAINRLAQSGDIDTLTGADILNGMISGLLGEVFVPLTKALTWRTIETDHGHHRLQVDLRNGESIRIEISGR